MSRAFPIDRDPDPEACFEAGLSTLCMAFQPIVSWGQHRVIGYEALLRTEESTLADPTLFADAAARLGRIHDLGRAARARTALDACHAPDGTRLFVNVHAADLLDDDLVVSAAPLSSLASRVTLEITERSALRDLREVQDRLKVLRGLGFRLAIDDLGVGYAGLSSLVLLNPEVVKIDMSLVRAVHDHPAKQEVIRWMVKLCSELDKELIVEGVETERERDTLVGLGCDLMQGFLFGRPTFTFASVHF